MSIFVLNNFIQKRGTGSYVAFLQMLNSGRHLSDIAARFNISTSRVSVLKDQLFDEKYVPKPWVRDYLESHFRLVEDDHNSIIEALNEPK